MLISALGRLLISPISARSLPVDPRTLVILHIFSPIHSRLRSFLKLLINVTMACEDANSKLLNVVTVADVDDEDWQHLVRIWELRFCHKA